MLKKYRLGDKIIRATEERYNRDFKEIGYVPYVEKKVADDKEEEKVVEKKKISKEK